MQRIEQGIVPKFDVPRPQRADARQFLCPLRIEQGENAKKARDPPSTVNTNARDTLALIPKIEFPLIESPHRRASESSPESSTPALWQF